jgi:hypothetical protein
MRRFILFLIAGAILITGNAWAETFQVEHEHFLRSCKGKLVFGDTTVEYVADKKEHSRAWKYEDIQQLAILPGRISILTYNTRKRDLGTDQTFDFKLLSGTLTDQFRQEIAAKLTHPIVSGILPANIEARFSIPARHRLFLNSSQGILEFGETYVLFRADEPGNSRMWRYDELLSLGSTGPFQLRLGALQKTGGEYGEEKNYVFDLKRRMTSEEYDFIWEKINLREK